MTNEPYFYMYRDAQREWRWRYRAANRETIAVSSESYVRSGDCETAIKLIKRDGPSAPIVQES